MTRLFVSYSHENRTFAKRLAEALGGRGLDVWIDEDGIHGGARWSTSVQQGLDTCDALVLLVSEAAMSSKHVEDEWQYVLDQDKPVLPVLLEPTKMHFQLSRIHYVDFGQRDFDEAFAQLEASIAQVVGGLKADGSELSEAPVVDDGVSPYRGLHAFREQDAPYFFGRETFTHLLVDALSESPMVAVIGPSGSGKSSVVHAGLVPGLRGAGDNGWTVLDMRPGDSPLHALAGVLVPLLEPDITATGRLVEVRRLGDALAESTVRLSEVLQLLAEKQPEVGRILLLADQFEELYTLCAEEGAQRAFQDMLFEAAFHPGDGTPLKLGLTLRADFMGHALAYRPFADAVQHHQVLLGPMNRDELARAIARPAELHGRIFESGLVERIMNDVGEKAGRLPLLEFALAKLWDQQADGRLTHAAYERIGHVEGAVARHADSVYERLDEEDRERTRRVIVQLVQPGEGTEDTRRIATHSELADDWDLVRRLADERLVTTGLGTDGGQTVEVVHEALIRSWGRLVGWMKSDRRFRTWQERLRFAIRQWSDAERDPGALLRGVPLAEAEEWLQERGVELVAEEAEYVRASVAHRQLQETRKADRQARERRLEERSRRLLRLVAAVSTASAVIALVLAGIAARARKSALIESERSRGIALASAAQVVLGNHDSELALALAHAANDLAPDAPEVEIALADSAYAPGLRRTMKGHAAGVLDIALDSTGTMALSGSLDHTVMQWDVLSGEGKVLLDADGADVAAVAFDPAGRTMAAGGQYGRLWFWSEADTPPRRLFGHTSTVQDLVFIPTRGESMLASAGADGSIRLWDLEMGREIQRWEGHDSAVVSLAVDRAGEWLVSSGRDQRAVLWSVHEGRAVASFDGHGDSVWSVAISPDARYVLTGTGFNDRRVRLWDRESGRLLHTFHGHGQAVGDLAFSADGVLAFSTASDRTVRVLHVEQRLEVARLKNGGSGRVAMHPDGRTLWTTGPDFSLQEWDAQSGTFVQRFSGENDFVTDLAIDPDGTRILSCSWDGSLILWDMRTGREIRSFEGHGPELYRVAIDSEGRQALSGGNDNTMRLWDLATGAELALFEHPADVQDLAFSPDDRQAISGAMDGLIRVWDLDNPKNPRVIGSPGSALRGLALNAAGDKVITGHNDGTVAIWDVPSGERLHLMKDHGSGAVFELEFTPDGRRAVSGGRDMILWDVETGIAVRRFRMPEIVYNLAITPDGRHVVAGTGAAEVSLWDLETGRELRHYEGHVEGVDGLEVTPDGRYAVSGSRDATMIQWRLEPQREDLSQWIAAHRQVRWPTCEEFESAGGGACSEQMNGETVRFDPTGPFTEADDALAPPGATADGPERTEPTQGAALRRVEKGSLQPGWSTGDSDSGAVHLWRVKPEGGRALDLQLRVRELGEGSVDDSSDGTVVLSLIDPEEGLLRRATTAAFTTITLTNIALRGGQDHVIEISPLAGGQALPNYELELVQRPRASGEALDLGRAAYGDLLAWPVASGVVASTTEGPLLWWVENDGTPPRVLIGHQGLRVFALTSDSAGSRLISGDARGKVLLWDIRSGNAISTTLSDEAGQVRALAMDPQGEQFYSTGDTESGAVAWVLGRGQVMEFPAVEGARGNDLALDDSATRIVGGFTNGDVVLWDTASGQPLWQGKHDEQVWGVDITHDGRFVASSAGVSSSELRPSLDNTIGIWSADDGNRLATLKGHSSAVYAVAFVGDGSKVVSASRDGSLRLWDWRASTELVRNLDHGTLVRRLAVSPDGDAVLSLGFDQVVRRWDVSEWLRLESPPVP